MARSGVNVTGWLASGSTHQTGSGSLADALGPARWESEIAHTCSALTREAPPAPQHISSVLESRTALLSVCKLGDLLPQFINTSPSGAAELRECCRGQGGWQMRVPQTGNAEGLDDGICPLEYCPVR